MKIRDVKDNFSVSALNYQKYSQIQKLSCENLYNISKDFIDLEDIIVDLGSGPAYLEKYIPSDNFINLDLSHEMLKLSDKDKIQADFSFLPLKNASVKTIISSFALQWSFNIEKTLQEISRVLKKEGFLCFCVPNNQSFREIIDSSVRSGSNFSFLNLTDQNKLTNILDIVGLKKIDIKNYIIQKEYNSAIDFLKNIKKIGAKINAKNDRFISKDNLESFNKIFELEYNNSASWNIDFYIYQK